MNDGGKATALRQLQGRGFDVPEFYVAHPGAENSEILAGFDELFDDDTNVAVRSSAVGEDGAEHSFAGQFESYLFVQRQDVVARCHDVWNSGQSERVDAYRDERGAESAKPAALIQRMIDPAAAGVAFSADPVTGRRRIAIVSAVEGVGEKLVSGEADSDNFEVSVDGEIETEATDPCLTDAQVREVAQLARSCENAFGRPQDIEWAFDKDGKLWLLQSRPITTLAGKPDPDAPRRIWDNANIAESYSGVTTPLTYTFARRAYENVYRQFCLILNVPKDRVAKSDAVFKAMIGFIRGRIYYNLVNWYRVLALLPGFKLNRAFMEQMMGVKEPMPPEIVAEIENDNTTSRFRDGLDLANTLGGLIREHWRLPRSIRDFHARLADALVESSPSWQPEDWVAHYRDLERKLLTRWDAPLVNDFLAMIFCGVLRKLTAKWCNDESGALANGLLRDVGEVISVEPARRIRAMAEKKANGEDIDDDVAAYLEKFGDRCLEELKLESQTLRDDSSPLTTSVEALAKRIRSGTRQSFESAPPAAADNEILANSATYKRIIFNWVLKHARGRVRDRENLRFERTRVFGRVRQIVRTLGDRLAEQGLIVERDDVFYLHLEEILDHFEHTSAQPITPELIATRKAEFAEYRAEDPPPDRFETFGPPGAYREFEDLLEAQQLLEGDLKGTGACAGRVRGPVRVVRDPRGVTLEPGEILVAQQTDPGWVTLFPAAAGLLVERGSLLSHSAIVAREMGIPAIVSIQSVTKILEDGQEVEMDGETGIIQVL